MTVQVCTSFSLSLDGVLELLMINRRIQCSMIQISGKSWIAAGFVKWLESAGARPVPIRYVHLVTMCVSPSLLVMLVKVFLFVCLCITRFYATDGELRRLFKSINGIIFPVRDNFWIGFGGG